MSYWRCMLSLNHMGVRWAVIVAQADGWAGSAIDSVHEVRRAASQLWPSLHVNWPSLDPDEPAQPGSAAVDVLDGLAAGGQIWTLSLRTPVVTADVRNEDRLVGRVVAEIAERGDCCARRGDTMDALVEARQMRNRGPRQGAVRRDRCDQCGQFMDQLAEALFWRPGSPHRFGERCMLTLDRPGARWTAIVAESGSDWPSDAIGDLRKAVGRLWPSLRVDWADLGANSGGRPDERPVDADVVDGGRVVGGRIMGGRVVGRVLVGAL